MNTVIIHALRQEEADRDLAKCNMCLFFAVLSVSGFESICAKLEKEKKKGHAVCSGLDDCY